LGVVSAVNPFGVDELLEVPVLEVVAVEPFALVIVVVLVVVFELELLDPQPAASSSAQHAIATATGPLLIDRSFLGGACLQPKRACSRPGRSGLTGTGRP
jgi:hypothetical protein